MPGHRGGVVRSRAEGSVMELDRRDGIVWLDSVAATRKGGLAWIKQNRFVSPSARCGEAYKQVKANRSARQGVDGKSLQFFEGFYGD